jgi:transcription elongation factor Elf1
MLAILKGFAEAQQRDIERKFRCPECGAVTRVDADDPRESVACWTADMGIICTGRAVANPTAEAMADLRAWQFERAAR